MGTVRPAILFPRRAITPLSSIVRRFAVALGVVIVVALITWFGRDGYRDADGNGVSLLDAFYYSTVTVSTTGYGDITPITPRARAVTAFVVTPLRILFLVMLVGTTIAVLTERFRDAVAQNRWRRRVKDHTIVIGYGTKGRSAAESLVASGTPPHDLVIVDAAEAAVHDAESAGFTAVQGDATFTSVLTEAMVDRARAVVVTCARDDTATLVTLTAHELNPAAKIVAAVKDSENAHLLHESGAGTVVTSSEAAGRLLGLATSQPCAVDVLEDLIVAGKGMQLVEHDAAPDELNGPPRQQPGRLPIAIVRDNHRIAFDDERFASLRAGDVVISLHTE